MKRRQWVLFALPFLLVLAVVVVPVSADPAGSAAPFKPATVSCAEASSPPAEVVASPVPATGADDQFTPVVCRISFCSQTIGYKCVNTGTCTTGGCRYAQVEDENCTTPEDPPFNSCGGCF
jgi:hypothetical protein